MREERALLWRQHIRHWVRRPKLMVIWLVRHELLAVLLAVLLIVAGTWGFIELAEVVLAGETQAFDEWAVRVLRHPENPADPRGPRWLAEVGRDITALGSGAVLTLVTVGVIGFLLLQRKRGAALLVMAITASGGLLSELLKEFYGRPRPDVLPEAWPISPSFPSGHSMLSTVVYLSLGTLLARVESPGIIRTYLIGVALFLSFLIGISRVYLGLHYPTDILAGWTVGLVWAVVSWLAAWYLQRRGAVELSEGNRGSPPS